MMKWLAPFASVLGLVLGSAAAGGEGGAPAPPLQQQLEKEGVAALARAARAQGDASRGAFVFYRPELVCTRDGYFGYAEVNWADPWAKWTWHSISERIAADKFETDDKSLRLSPNELDSVVYCFGKGPKIEQVQDLAQKIDGNAPGDYQ